jgi:hypothetical protein
LYNIFYSSNVDAADDCVDERYHAAEARDRELPTRVGDQTRGARKMPSASGSRVCRSQRHASARCTPKSADNAESRLTYAKLHIGHKVGSQGCFPVPIRQPRLYLCRQTLSLWRCIAAISW